MRRVTLLVFGIATFQCASAIAPPRSPSNGGNAWYELTTTHFVLRTDMEPDVARDAAADFEEAYAELVAAGFPRGAGPAGRLALVVLRDEQELAEYWTDRGGFYSERLYSDLEHEPTIVLAGARYPMKSYQRRAHFLHELTHRFVAYTYGGLPTWANEGMAEYYAWLRVEDGSLVIGDIPYGTGMAAPGLAPTIAELVSADQSTFYGAGPGTPEQKSDRRTLYYNGAWALVHFFFDGPPDVRGQFRAYLDAVAGGARASDAWTKAFGGPPPATLESQFYAYLGATSWQKLLVPVRAPLGAGKIEGQRTMGDVEIDILWSRLLGGQERTKALARGALEDAAARQPDAPEVAYRQGALALREGKDHEARARFEAALARTPDDPRLLRALALVSRGDGSKLVAVMDRLTAHAVSPDQLSMSAAYAMARGNIAAALELADRAVLADPGYYGALATRAEVHFASGHFAEAVTDQEHALAIFPEQLDARKPIERLARYRAAAASGH